MQVRAISVGHAVPRMQFDAVVHSVFASAVNLKARDEGPLLTLLASTEGDLPQSIRLEAVVPSPFETMAVGMRVACREGTLRFEDQPLTIDQREASCWDSNLPKLEAGMQQPATQAAWKCAWHALNEQQAHRASELRANSLLDVAAEARPAWLQRASSCMSAIVRGTIRCDLEWAAPIQDLIGLGPGLTPAGDDLAAGYLLGLRYAACGRQDRSAFMSSLAHAVMHLLPRTGDISGTYLFHAARGEPSSTLFGLASSVCSGAPASTVRESTEAAMRAGHTSGMDTVTGLLMGIAAWDASGLLGPAFQVQAH